MDTLLMKKDLAKLTLFRELVYNQPKELSLDYFSELLNISKRSTLRTVEELAHDLEKDFEDMVYTDYDDKFQIFLWIALALIIIDFFILEKKSPILAKFNLFGENK